MSNMFARKLQALEYPARACCNVQDNNDLRDLIIWLEMYKIRQYKPEDRNAFSKTPNPGWMQLYQAYLKDADCPYEETDNDVTASVDWLLGYAIRLEYADSVDKFSELSAESVQSRNTNHDRNPLDSLDYESPAFRDGVHKLATLLNIAPHGTDHKMTLRAIAKYADMYLSERARKKPPKEGKPMDLTELDLGFSLGDSGADEAAKVLRLLFLHDVRDLQTKINEAIVAVQTITADPKTDTRLGKVGF